MKARLIVEGDDGTKKLPVGTILEDPRAFRLVQMGVAEPADEECRQRAGMTDAQMQAAQEAQRKLNPGLVQGDNE